MIQVFSFDACPWCTKAKKYLDKKGVKVLAIPGAEISRGRGGPRCMSCPINRDDI